MRAWVALFLVMLVTGAAPLVTAESGSAALKPIDYNRDIRPILSENCYACHGPDHEKRKAGLRLDIREDAFKALKSGGFAIVPHDASKSALISRVTTADEDERMPPLKSGKKLSAAQIETLTRWVQDGARWSGHWAYVKPESPALPEVKNQAWPRNEIDHFILARLEKEGLQPSPEADRTRLIRRATQDLTGLPPTVAEVENFLYDSSPGAYEKLVDRLLSSTQYGERMAQDWLDLARFSDSQGYHHDSHRDLWPWRDWVINSFNKNMPFDQFTVEQLAGDLLPGATREQRLATGFHRNEMTTSEGGAMPEEYAVKYVVGRVDTTARVWLGTSLACAECHDHKYDPISQKDFYRFFAYFNTIPENGLDQELNPVPRLLLDTPEQRAKTDEFTRDIAALEKAQRGLLEMDNPEQSLAQAQWETGLRQNVVSNWTVPPLIRMGSTGGATLRERPDGSVAVGGLNPAKDVYEITLRTRAENITGVRLEALPAEAENGQTTEKLGRSEAGEFVLSRFEATARSLGSPNTSVKSAATLGVWHALGPFKASSAREAFDKAYGPESEVDLSKTYQDGALRWTKHPEWVDGHPHGLPGETSATYLYRTLRIAEPRLAKLSFGSDDGLQVWWNGRKILSRDVARAVGANQDQAVVRLSAGENKLLVKISNGAGAAGFYFALLDEPVLEQSVEFAAAVADFNRKDYDVKGVLDGDPASGWAIGGEGANLGHSHEALLRSVEPFGFKEGTELTVRLKFESDKPRHALRRFRVALTISDKLGDFMGLPENVRAGLKRPATELSAAQKLELQRFYRQTFVTEVKDLGKLLEAQRKAKQEFTNSLPVTMVMQEMEKPRDTFLLVRGNFAQHGEKVTPGVPASLMPMPPEYPANRLGLAKWLVHPDHPLVSRVTVNHFWQHYFGTGLVKSAEDFGSQGEWPSHPELLDWLATQFIRCHWDIKAMQQLIVTSATYRQAPALTPQLLQKDPDDRLLARFPRLRLDAEAIRDNALAVSGLLNPKVGGPSVYPYQPPGLWEAVAFEGTRKYEQSPGADSYRRGIYTYWRRSLPYPSLITFDAPTRETCTVRRPRTNTPLQALTLMNDPVYVEASRAFGQRIMREVGSTLSGRLGYAFRVCLGRPPTRAEETLLESAFKKHLGTFEQDRVAASKLIHMGSSSPAVDLDVCELAAWTLISTTLLNLDETITKG